MLPSIANGGMNISPAQSTANCLPVKSSLTRRHVKIRLRLIAAGNGYNRPIGIGSKAANIAVQKQIQLPVERSRIVKAAWILRSVVSTFPLGLACPV